MAKFDRSEAKSSVITVGGGRGFVIEAGDERLVITAAHCLPELPAAASFVSYHEKTYSALLGKLGEESTVSCECRFVDLVSDLAVLGPPDRQELWHECEFYDALTDESVALPVTNPPDEGPGWLLSLDGEWIRCKLWSIHGREWSVREASKNIEAGMSGSPILADDGSAVGVVVCSFGEKGEAHTQGGPNPRLGINLPGWLLHRLP